MVPVPVDLEPGVGSEPLSDAWEGVQHQHQLGEAVTEKRRYGGPCSSTGGHQTTLAAKTNGTWRPQPRLSATPAKAEASLSSSSSSSSLATQLAHPQGVRPLGNALLYRHPHRGHGWFEERRLRLGTLAVLSDEALLALLGVLLELEDHRDDDDDDVRAHRGRESRIDDAATREDHAHGSARGKQGTLGGDESSPLSLGESLVVKLGRCSALLWRFCSFEALWREALRKRLSCHPSAAAAGGQRLEVWRGSWRRTYFVQLRRGKVPLEPVPFRRIPRRRIPRPGPDVVQRRRGEDVEKTRGEDDDVAAAAAGAASREGGKDDDATTTSEEHARKLARRFPCFSDVLYEPFLLATTPLEAFAAEDTRTRGEPTTETCPSGAGEEGATAADSGSTARHEGSDTCGAGLGGAVQLLPRLRPEAYPARRFFEEFASRHRPCILARPTYGRDGAVATQPACLGWTMRYVFGGGGAQGASSAGRGAAAAVGADAGGWARHHEFQCEAWRCSGEVYADYSRSCQRHARLASRARRCARDEDEEGEDREEASDDDDEAEWFDASAVPDESPFYLFDARFADRDARAAREWTVPDQLAWAPRWDEVRRYDAVLSSRSHDGEQGGARHAAEGTEDDVASASAREAERHEAMRGAAMGETEADLFRLMGERRPDHRWIIAGPARSGSGWHKDPNMTSAWNTVLSGRKAWMMLPPDVVPPGVFVSDDEAEVTAPLSVAEWLRVYHVETRRRHGPRVARRGGVGGAGGGGGGDGRLWEGVCGPGETVYVPSGWWHLVFNLEETVALTQNFVGVAELPRVLDFLANRPAQVSGFKMVESVGEEEGEGEEEECGDGDAPSSDRNGGAGVEGFFGRDGKPRRDTVGKRLGSSAAAPAFGAPAATATAAAASTASARRRRWQNVDDCDEEQEAIRQGRRMHRLFRRALARREGGAVLLQWATRSAEQLEEERRRARRGKQLVGRRAGDGSGAPTSASAARLATARREKAQLLGSVDETPADGAPRATWWTRLKRGADVANHAAADGTAVRSEAQEPERQRRRLGAANGDGGAETPAEGTSDGGDRLHAVGREGKGDESEAPADANGGGGGGGFSLAHLAGEDDLGEVPW